MLSVLGVWDEISSRASFGFNASEVLRWVADGSAEVGVVFITDALGMAGRVRVIETVPDRMLKTPVVYPAGLNTDLGDKAEAAAAFFNFLKGEAAAAVFVSHGFRTFYPDETQVG
jgi:molybdate transport system substrate-binding protein